MRWQLVGLVVVLSACGGPVIPVEDGGVGDAGYTPSDGGLDLNDVSWLVPLSSSMLSLESTGARGALLPRALYDALPVLLPNTTSEALHGDFRIVGIRVDPCFPTDAHNTGCLKQLRLVAQPVVFTPLATTHDAALHLFYDLSEADWADVRATLRDLKALAGRSTQGAPLDVHPVLRAQGLGGAYGAKLHALVTRLCGAQNLSRVAFMRLVQEDVAWRFGALDVVNGVLVADVIPRLNALTEQGVQEFGNTTFRSGELQPEAAGDQLPVLLSESELRLTDDRTLQRAVTSALRLENPGRSSPETADCGSCHVATRALTNAKRQRQLDVSTHADAFVGASRFNLNRVDAVGDDPRALRAFGYFGDKSALSQRTINESAEVAEALSR